MSGDRVRVDLGSRSYDIHIGNGLLAQAGTLIAPLLRSPRVFILTDATVAPLYLAPLQASLEAAGIRSQTLVVPVGESSKSFARLEAVMAAMLEARCERSTTLIALGGGVIGDLGGFAAAIYQRGIDFIQIPTTLLAQVDSSVGGKTGINMPQGKNMVGAFHQPRLVLADLDTLNSLPLRQLRAGYAEVVKYGCIDDEAFFCWLEQHGPALLAGDQAARRHAVKVSCEAKARIVAADEREGNIRALLNLGHTFGHAFEAELGYSDALLHGEAVALGLVLAFRLSARMGLTTEAAVQRLIQHLVAAGLPITPPSGYTWHVKPLLEHMAGDKKVKNGRLTFVLVKAIGAAFLDNNVEDNDLRATLEDYVAETSF